MPAAGRINGRIRPPLLGVRRQRPAKKGRGRHPEVMSLVLRRRDGRRLSSFHFFIFKSPNISSRFLNTRRAGVSAVAWHWQ